MIEGIRIELTTDELKQHFDARVAHHSERETFYNGQADALKAGGVEAVKYTTNDPTSSLLQSARQHADRRAFFAFMAAHLIPSETYRLSESDFTRLEFAAMLY